MTTEVQSLWIIVEPQPLLVLEVICSILSPGCVSKLSLQRKQKIVKNLKIKKEQKRIVFDSAYFYSNNGRKNKIYMLTFYIEKRGLF